MDLKTGEIYKSLSLRNLYVSPNIFYSKITNKFYTFSLSSQSIYEFSLDDINPDAILNVSGMGNYNFKISEDGNYIYLAQKDSTSGALYLSKFNLITRENITLIKISSEEKENLSWISFDITGDTIVYAFYSQKDDIHDPTFYKSKLYTANISEDSLTNTQLLYSTPNGEATTLWFNLSEDGSKLLTNIYSFQSGYKISDTNDFTIQNSLYQKQN